MTVPEPLTASQPADDRDGALQSSQTVAPMPSPPRKKLVGRRFYESIGSPKMILAPMVDQSEFAWRLLTRSFLPREKRSGILAYTPMFHSRLFAETAKYREQNFQPIKTDSACASASSSTASDSQEFLDGNTSIDRPLIVQFCANDPSELLKAAQLVQPYCDAVDLNLGCPQGIAKRGKYGAFLQEDWDLIYKLINTLHRELDVPVTAKMRILESKQRTLDYARTILSAGASILTVHGRQREQKGHNTGLADWSTIRYLRDNLPPDTVLFANGNILQHGDIQTCLDETGADGVMSAEGNLYDPTIFTSPPPPSDVSNREYWRGHGGIGGYRMDAVLRRYFDIVHKYVLGTHPPARRPLFLPTDPPGPNEAPVISATEPGTQVGEDEHQQQQDEPPSKKRKRDTGGRNSGKKSIRTCPNLSAMQAHLFHLLRPLVSKHTNIRDALARCRAGDMPAYEAVLSMVEAATADGLREHEETGSWTDAIPKPKKPPTENSTKAAAAAASSPSPSMRPDESSVAAVERCRRPWWVCQSHVRPLPAEAIEKGALTAKGKKSQPHNIAGRDVSEMQKPSNGTFRDVAPPLPLSPSPLPPPATPPTAIPPSSSSTRPATPAIPRAAAAVAAATPSSSPAPPAPAPPVTQPVAVAAAAAINAEASVAEAVQVDVQDDALKERLISG
ncbi:MAG: hypothetical protein M1825_004553 [Sarcosagium campestre]|nr:MAG: hypothetical protein M1825_004553 [Sarcosagium campestre]